MHLSAHLCAGQYVWYSLNEVNNTSYFQSTVLNKIFADIFWFNADTPKTQLWQLSKCWSLPFLEDFFFGPLISQALKNYAQNPMLSGIRFKII